MKHKTFAMIVLSMVLLSGGLSVAQAAPPAQTEGEGQEYVVQADDWLSKIADKFYGDMFAYPSIVEATNAKAADDDPRFSLRIRAGLPRMSESPEA